MKHRYLVFQHIDVEHPGFFRDLMRAKGISWDTIHFDLHHRIPTDINKYSGLLSMGGPMDVWEKDRYPWISKEEEFIRKWVLEYKKPFLGICLGHQLLATALGGRVAKAQTAEIGIHKVSLTQKGQSHNFFNQCPIEFECLQWHGAEVTVEPPDSQILAQSKDCKIQSLAVGNHAFSFQFHLEVTPTTVDEWGEIETYKIALESVLGVNGLDRFRTETTANLSSFNWLAKKIFYNWQKTSNF